MSLLDIEASFIKNGGDSLSALQLKVGLRKCGVNIALDSIFTTNKLGNLACKSSSS